MACRASTAMVLTIGVCYATQIPDNPKPPPEEGTASADGQPDGKRDASPLTTSRFMGRYV
ncbi:hypothetical protein M433DRAFT_158192 [Acidomyces richmondensis BFW]|nr:MAG: hypothetical protein FE78DRAFT_89359 [Acidomyces sp. 'richmondensis']KYG42175.1 hypothetical protein M433DRAFT_158192 [Acidomyces richmondensis BFW]